MKHYLVMLAGQSNMQGLGWNYELSDFEQSISSYQNMNIYYDGVYYCHSTVHPFEKRLQQLKPGFGCNEHQNGPELGLALKLRELHKDDMFTFVKIVLSGSSIESWNHNVQDSMFFRLVESVKNITFHSTVELLGLLWMQGESDALPGRDILYYDRFQQLCHALRVHLQSNLPIIAGLIYEYEYFNQTSIHIVRSALMQIANSTVSTHDLTFVDGVHYDSRSNIILGGRFAEALFQKNTQYHDITFIAYLISFSGMILLFISVILGRKS